MSVVDTVEILKGRELSDEEYFKAGVLGWSVELVSCSLYFGSELQNFLSLDFFF